jgi:hypothetical protein
MTPAGLAKSLSRLLSAHQSEAELCDLVEEHLSVVLGLTTTREAYIGDDRVDFLVETGEARIGVEVKVKGGRRPILRQLGRYAQSGRVDALVLLTTMPGHAQIPRLIGGVPVHVAVMLENCLG